MYGLVHEALAAWLLARPDGEADLQQVLELSGIDAGADVSSISFYRHYEDEESTAMINAATIVTNTPECEVVRGMGEVTLQVMLDMGFEPLVRSLGNSFYELIQNLDSFHLSMAKTYPKLKAPYFRMERVDVRKCRCHYYSSFDNLTPYAEALLLGVAKGVFNLDITIELEESRENGADHDIFLMDMPKEYVCSIEGDSFNVFALYITNS